MKRTLQWVLISVALALGAIGGVAAHHTGIAGHSGVVRLADETPPPWP